MKLKILIVILVAMLGHTCVQAQTATQVLPAEQCFQATTGINGMVGAIGSITSGSNYVNGTYGGVPLTGGSGSGSTANITVSGGSVIAVAILNPGTQYIVGDSLSASNANLGGSGSGFAIPILSVAINSSLAGGTVGYYIPSTLTFKQTWKNANETILNQNPVPLDQNGCAIVYGSGIYRQILKDSLGNTVWDQPTASVGSGGGGGQPAGAMAVGSILPFAGLVPPSGWVYANGQALSRATYPDAFSALTIVESGQCSMGSPLITGLVDISQMRIGQPVEAICLAPGTTIASITGLNSITVTTNATVSIATTFRIFPWGNGDNATTFNVPDLRGRVPAGDDFLESTFANRLTAAGCGVLANAPGVPCGNQTQTIAQTNLPNVNFTASLSSVSATAITDTRVWSLSLPSQVVSNTAGSANVAIESASPTDANITSGIISIASGTITATTTTTTTGTAASGGSGAAFSIVQPTLTVSYIVKVITGTDGPQVTSIEGMTGLLTCSLPILCASQNIGFDINDLPQDVAPDANADMLVMRRASDGAFVKINPGTIAASATAGVSSLGGATGAIALDLGLYITGSGLYATTGLYPNIIGPQYGAVAGGSTSTNNAAIVAAEGAAKNIYGVPPGLYPTTKNFFNTTDVTQQYAGYGQFIDINGNQRGKWICPWSHVIGPNSNGMSPTTPSVESNGDWSQNCVQIEQIITAPLVLTTTVATIAPTLAGRILHFNASNIPATLVQNSSTSVVDVTAGAGIIPVGATVVSISGGDVTISADVLGTVNTADMISFGVGQYMQPQQASPVAVLSYAANGTLSNGQARLGGQYPNLSGQNITQFYAQAINDAGGGGFASYWSHCTITRAPGAYYDATVNPFNTASCGIIGGIVEALVPNVYLDGVEYDLLDNGNQVPATGHLIGLSRNTPGDQNHMWRAYLVSSFGSIPVDSAYSANGAFNFGVDFTAASFTGGTGSAAITLAAGQREYFNAVSGGAYPSSVGGEAIYSPGTGEVDIEVSGLDTLRIVTGGITTKIGGAQPSTDSGCKSGSGYVIDSNARNNAGALTAGSTATSCTITFANAFPTKVFCIAVDATAATALRVQSSSTAQLIISGFAGGDVISWICL